MRKSLKSRGIHTGFWSDNLKEDVGVDMRIILKLILNKHCGMLWTSFIWLRIGVARGFL